MTRSQLLGNRSLGASALLAAFGDLVPSLSDAEIETLLHRLKTQFPLMAVWHFAVDHFKQHGVDSGSIRQLQASIVESRSETLEKGLRQLAGFKRFATISRSSLVETLLIKLRSNTQIEVFCSHSLPAEEGWHLYQSLKLAGIRSRCLDDWELSDHLASVEALILGADWITENTIINKWGSKAIVRQALERAIPVLVIAEDYKHRPAIPWLEQDFYQDWSSAQSQRQIKVFECIPQTPGIQII